MDFGALPPETNSARMYSGPGSGPMLAAAAAWNRLAQELNASAAACRSVIAKLTSDGWQGPASTMMANAVSPYVTWLHSTAAQAEQTSLQARASTSAYQTAFAMTVSPPLIEANRTQLISLVAGNFFGQNSPAIAVTEAGYDAMWAQDAAAMHGYAVASATASRLTPFAGPPRSTNPAGPATQHAAVARSVTEPAATAPPPSLLTYLLQIPSLTSAAASTSSSSFSGSSIGVTNHAVAVNALRDDAQGIGPFLVGSAGPPAPAGPASAGGPAISAAMGRASLVNTLSVPQTWSAITTPAVPAPTAVIDPAALEKLPGQSMFGEALLGTLAGRGVSNVAAKLRRPSVIPRSPAAG